MKYQVLPEPFACRLPNIQLWQDSFGDDFGVADRVLCIFCDAFMFDEEERFKFEPDDTVMAIYRAVYPSRWTPDSLEYPFIIDALEKEFDFRFNPIKLEKIASFRQIVAEIKDAQHGRRH
ncbi:acyl carrier protein [Geobacter sulfurreducens]|uniref:acyl carrier protein n=1 Tax=Geobacter sulfurreducens TaxID=35554 RepID=UPI0020B85899|nr:acyl carrier protein [Geobacter sulfurreducens]UTG92094.1 acyl carrier protein [Geobacter sulfurreducens]